MTELSWAVNCPCGESHCRYASSVDGGLAPVSNGTLSNVDVVSELPKRGVMPPAAVGPELSKPADLVSEYRSYCSDYEGAISGGTDIGSAASV